jgi:acyl-CoA synthetase (NDP forming)
MVLPLLTEELAARIGATLPPAAATRNPVDLAGGGEQDFLNFERTVRALASSGEVDAVLLTGYFGGYSTESVDFARRETQVAVGMATAAEESERPLMVHTMYPASPSIRAIRSRHVPVYADIEAAVHVLGRLVARSEQPPSGVPALPAAITASPVLESYFEARALMADAGIPFVKACQVWKLTEAQFAASDLGYPVVLKALGSSRKSDRGGVQVGIAGEGALEAAFMEMKSRLKPPAFSVERMAATTDGVELIVGVRRDPSFGPVVVIGMGGVYADVLQDVAVALAPVSQDVADQLLRSLRGAPLLLGTRGRPALDLAAGARVAVALSVLAAERPDIAEIEINPVLVGREGALALDARIVRGGESATAL